MREAKRDERSVCMSACVCVWGGGFCGRFVVDGVPAG